MFGDNRLDLSDAIKRQAGSTSDAPAQERLPELLMWSRTAVHKAKGGMALVAPGLFLGNKQAAADRELLRGNGVVAVCAVGARQIFNDDLVYFHVSIEDDGSQSMLPHFHSATDFIHSHRARGAVLVHCKGGISRSPTMVIAYLMKYEHLSLLTAMEVCQKARPAARPRSTFLQDLEHFSEYLQNEAADLRAEELWARAVALATTENLVAWCAEEVATKQEVQIECRRLLLLLQTWCVEQAFGEPGEAREDLVDAAKRAVTNLAKAKGWTKIGRSNGDS